MKSANKIAAQIEERKKELKEGQVRLVIAILMFC
eukprot:SAG22_NODE_66_length_22936_cov_626.714279_13_plen_34_part_00